MNARKLMVLLIAVLALVAAGCGGDDSSDASEATETVVATDTSSDDSTEGTDDSATGELSGQCAELAGISSKLAQSLSGGTADLDEAAEVLDELADRVPEEIKDDYKVVAENFAKIAKALEGVDLTSGTPDAEALAKLRELGQTLDSPEVQRATANLEAWARENC